MSLPTNIWSGFTKYKLFRPFMHKGELPPGINLQMEHKAAGYSYVSLSYVPRMYCDKYQSYISLNLAHGFPVSQLSLEGLFLQGKTLYLALLTLSFPAQIHLGLKMYVKEDNHPFPITILKFDREWPLSLWANNKDIPFGNLDTFPGSSN